MADKKISELTASTTPLAGTEVLPVVQSGVTKKVSAENIATATRPNGVANGVTYLNGSKIPSSSAKLTFDGENLVVGSAGSASPATPLAINLGTIDELRAKITSPLYNADARWLGLGFGFTTNYVKAAIIAEAKDGTARSNLHFALNALTTSANVTLADSKFSVSYLGDATLPNGNLVIGTAGKGIDFSADGQAAGMTSELLDDYEEGTWTPVVADATSGGNEASAFAAVGRYTKVGRLVSYQISLINIDTTGLTAGNTVRITGLPFASANISAYSLPVGSVAQSAVNTTDGNIWAQVANNDSYLTLYEGRTTGNTVLIVSTLVSTAADFYISGQYLTA